MMKEGWEYKKLGELSSFIGDGDWIESKDQSTNGIRLIQTGNIGNGVYKSKEDKPHYISERTFEDLGCTEIFEGDCLVSRLPDPVGRACLIPKIPFRAITAVDCTIIRFNERVLSKYFVYYTQSTTYSKRVYLRTTGSTRKRISRKNLEAIDIPLPPLTQQQPIVAELDKINEIIDMKKAQLKDLDLLAQSIFYDMFGDPIENPKGWEVKKLGEVSKVKIGPFGSLLHKSDYVTGGTPLVNPIHMKDGHIVKDDNFTITDEKKNEMSAYLLKEGDVLFARRGEIGRSAIVTKHEDGYLCGTGSLFVRFQEKLNNVFVLYWTNSKSFITELVAQAKGATMLNINCKIVEDLNIILPPLPLQQSFASKIQAIESQKSAIKQSLAEVETLLASRMDYWFN